MKRILICDMGGFAIKACEVEFRRTRVAIAWSAQQTLPSEETGTLGERWGTALQMLLKEVKPRTRDVVIVVSDPELVVRPTVVPAIGREELETALGYSMTEVLPLPLEELIADYELVTPSTGVDPSGTPVLMVGSPAAVIEQAIMAVASTKLKVKRVDVGPLCDLEVGRALAPATGNCYLVDTGARTTTVSVISHGDIRLVRSLAIGGDAVTRTIQGALDVSWDEAEGIKRSLSGEVPSWLSKEDEEIARSAALASTERLVSEIVGSIDYFTLQRGLESAETLILVGGSSALVGLREKLSLQTGVVVDQVTSERVMSLLKSPLEAADIPVNWTTVVGAARRAKEDTKDHKRVSLLPAIVREREQVHREVGVAVLVLAVAAVGLGALTYRQIVEEHSLNSQLASARSQDALVALKVDHLARYGAMATTVNEDKKLVASALTGSISWPQVLTQIADATPSDSWLTSFTASAPSVGSTPTISFSVEGCSQLTPSQWLDSLHGVSFLGDMWVSQSSLSPGSSGSCPSSATPSADATEAGPTTFSASAQFVEGFSSYRITNYLSAIGVSK